MEEYPHVVQPRFEDVFRKDHELKGKWKNTFFGNNHPLVLELGCGRGEYTIGMAGHFKNKNFLGVDIKGARIWKGAKTVKEQSIGNAGFLRTRIELIESFFGKDEVDEIWITFPDPQLKIKRTKKRLTGSVFLNYYRGFLKKEGMVHLKTDSTELYEYTKKLLDENGLEIITATNDLYAEKQDDILRIHTHYEQKFLEEGEKITYLCFRLNNDKEVKEAEDEEY